MTKKSLLMVFLALVLSACSTLSRDFSAPDENADAFPDCRLMEPFGGYRSAAVIDRSSGREHGIHYLYRDEAAGIWVRKPVLTGRYSPRYPLAPNTHTRVYWSSNDDLVIWNEIAIWMITHSTVTFALTPTFDSWSTRRIGMIALSPRDAIPEHIRWIARNHGQTLRKWGVEFDVRTGGIWSSAFGPGYGNDTAWTEDDVYIRIRNYPRWFRVLETFNSDREEWSTFHPRPLSQGARLYLFRRDLDSGSFEAIVGLPNDDGSETVERLEQGNLAPVIIAAGRFRDVVASPDRLKLFGKIDEEGRFRRAAGEIFSEDESFWFSYLEARVGTEKFYILDDGRFLLLKSADGDGARISILERAGDDVRESYRICG